jgi:SAM-dependent methyltransferase
MGTDDAKSNYLKSIRKTQIDPGASEQYLHFVKFVDSNSRSAEHYVRYCRTFRTMDDRIGSIKGANIIETGGPSPILNFFEKDNQCSISKSDLRASIDAASESANFVLSLEVLEHIKDAPEKSFDEIVLFQGTGARNYASEIVRVLRPGGVLILTTPNPASYRAFKRLVDGEAPCIFRPHVREYTRQEIIDLFSALELIHHETQFNFFIMSEAAQEEFNSIFTTSGWSLENRGDDHVFLFRKRV